MKDNLSEIISHKEDQTFDCKSIQIDPKVLAIPIVAFAKIISLTSDNMHL
jgi:hypothetical protein